LEQLLRPRLAGAGPSATEPKLRVFLRPSLAFRLPGSVSAPLILVGPGTGVAPFVGFLQHRAVMKAERETAGDDVSTGLWRGGFEIEAADLPAECPSSVTQFLKESPEGPVHLFFGCRDAGDFLYKDELQQREREGTLSSLEVAMSRLSTSPEKVYVTHRLLARGPEIARLLRQEGAYVYVCGDGTKMAKDVYAAVKNVLQVHGGLSEADADAELDDMKLRRRYVVDIWS